MIVYDVVQIVQPGCMTSTPPGRWLCQHHDSEPTANMLAAIFNEKASTPGMEYRVERHDEESPERAETVGDWRRRTIYAEQKTSDSTCQIAGE